MEMEKDEADLIAIVKQVKKDGFGEVIVSIQDEKIKIVKKTVTIKL